ncbi:MAG: hypothetical protein US74_C0015G0005 [Parcubacteria group bacterium GW2011_GWA2_38_13]|nr:MAG: hypothetical protein US74_C0015G0005 [Parcubacteria group bacterium GW2011_GWA2_38_13]
MTEKSEGQQFEPACGLPLEDGDHKKCEKVEEAEPDKEKPEIKLTEDQEKAKQSMIDHLSHGRIFYALLIKVGSQLPEEVVQSAAKEGMIKCLSCDQIDDALEIKDDFKVPEEVVQSAAKEGMIKCLSDSRLNSALNIKNRLKVSKEILQSPELHSAAKEGMIEHLSHGWVDAALEVRENFFVQITPREIIDAFPDLQELLVKLQEKSAQFYRQATRSLEVVMSLFNYRGAPEKLFTTVDENPFLFDAVERNPRFGTKLLVKFESLDASSRENITFLYTAKNEIMAAHPEIDPESLEFRQAMQEKLKDFKRNTEIYKAIEASGIAVEQWLAYDEVRYFSLASRKNTVAFSETIATPINRIKETIDSYAHLIKETVKPYHKELSEHQIPVAESGGIDEKIAKMRGEYEKAKREGNEKKSQGILKGMESTEKSKEKTATVSVWNKLINTINSFQLLKNDVHLAHERAMEAEAKFQELTAQKAPSGKEIREQKEKIAKAKDELRTKFSVLERRMEDFRNTLYATILPALGEERSAGLIQEIQQGFQEQLTHYDVDRSTLANLFSERQDAEKEKLESQPMSIFVWARNPDIDLYQANYSPCCISIESGYHADGAESTIADYTTDLGIQIVNIWDETKQEPVTAAWCWLGEDEGGTPVLVVDNIESNTLYSSNYPEQLTQELFEFLQEYARTIGAKKVVLGKRNNDLPTASNQNILRDDESTYKKIGNSNRPDGYFLEAEEKSVKIIWDEKDENPKRQNMEKKEKTDLPKVQFKGLVTKDLTEKDFSEILRLERTIYQQEDEDLIAGQGLIQDINDEKGLEYSITLQGTRKGKKTLEMLGYIVGVEDETSDGEPCVYLEDIAVAPEAQGQGIGWNMMEAFTQKLKEKAKEQKKPVLLDMHLRPNSQRFMERHKEDLERLGVQLLEEAVENDYYGEGDDALYQLYEVRE